MRSIKTYTIYTPTHPIFQFLTEKPKQRSIIYNRISFPFFRSF